MCLGLASSRKYSVTCLSERCRPNQVFHQNRNGMSTRSHPVTKKRTRWRVDMPGRGFGSACSGVTGGVGFADTTMDYTLLDDISVEHPFLFEIVRDGVLREKRRLEPDLGPNPFTLSVRFCRAMLARAARSVLRSEVCALNLVELLDVLPCRIAHSS